MAEENYLIRLVISARNELGPVVRAVQGEVDKMERSFKDADRSAQDFGKRMDQVEQKLGKARDTVKSINPTLDSLDRRLKGVRDSTTGVGRGLDAMGRRLGRVNEALDTTVRTANRLEKRLERFDNKLQAMSQREHNIELDVDDAVANAKADALLFKLGSATRRKYEFRTDVEIGAAERKVQSLQRDLEKLGQGEEAARLVASIDEQVEKARIGKARESAFAQEAKDAKELVGLTAQLINLRERSADRQLRHADDIDNKERANRRRREVAIERQERAFASAREKEARDHERAVENQFRLLDQLGARFARAVSIKGFVDKQQMRGEVEGAVNELQRLGLGRDAIRLRAKVDIDRNSFDDFVIAARQLGERAHFSFHGTFGLLRDQVIGLMLLFSGPLLSALTGVVGGLVAVAGAAVQAAAGLGGLAVAAAAQAAPALGILAGALARVSGVTEALDAAEKLREQGSQQASQADTRRANAADTLRNAHRAVRDAVERVREAEERVADAQARARQAQRDLTQARREGRRELEDLIMAERAAELASRRSSLGLQQSRIALARSIGEGSGLVASQQLEVEEARLQRDRSGVSLRRQRTDTREAVQGGVEGLPNVRRARQDVKEAREGVGDAREAVDDAAEGVQDAQRRVAQAARGVAESAATTGAAGDAFALAFSKLSAGERELYRALQELRGELAKTEGPLRQITDTLISSFAYGVRGVTELLRDPEILAAAQELSDAMAGQFREFTDFATSEYAREGIVFFSKESAANMDELGSIAQSLATFFMEIARAASGPLADALDGIDRYLRRIAEWSKSAEGRGALAAYFEATKEPIRAVLDLIGSVVHMLHTLATTGGGAESGSRIMRGLADEADRAAHNIEANREEVRQFFRDSERVFYQIYRVLLAIGKALIDAMNPDDVKLFADILIDTLIPAVVVFLQVLTDILHILQPILGSEIVGFLLKVAAGFMAFNFIWGRIIGLGAKVVGIFGTLAGASKTLTSGLGGLRLAFLALAGGKGIGAAIAAFSAYRIAARRGAQVAAAPVFTRGAAGLATAAAAGGVAGAALRGRGGARGRLTAGLAAGAIALGGRRIPGLGRLARGGRRVGRGAGRIPGARLAGRAAMGFARLLGPVGLGIAGISGIHAAATGGGGVGARAQNFASGATLGLVPKNVTEGEKSVEGLARALKEAAKAGDGVRLARIAREAKRLADEGGPAEEQLKEIARQADAVGRSVKTGTREIEFFARGMSKGARNLSELQEAGKLAKATLDATFMEEGPERSRYVEGIYDSYIEGIERLRRDGKISAETANREIKEALFDKKLVSGRDVEGITDQFVDTFRKMGTEGVDVVIGQLTKMPPKARSEALQTTLGMLEQMRSEGNGFPGITKVIENFRLQAGTKFQQFRDNAIGRSQTMSAGVISAIHNMATTAVSGLVGGEGSLGGAFNQFLETMGVAKKPFKAIKMKDIRERQSQSNYGRGGGLAEGGFVGEEGERGQDSWRQTVHGRPVGRGEAIVPGPHQRYLGYATQAVFGHGFADTFKRVRGAHAGYLGGPGFAGGFAGKSPSGLKTVPIPGFPGEYIAQRVLNDALGLVRRFKLMVTDAFATSGHRGRGHLFYGTAMDVVPGRGGSWDTVDRAVAYARSKGLTVLYNGVPNHGRGHHAHIELRPGAIGGGGITGIDGAPRLPRIRLQGPDGALKDTGQGVVDQARKAAQKRLDAIAAEQMGSTNDPPHGRGGGIGEEAARQVIARAMGVAGVPERLRSAWMAMAVRQARRESNFNPNAQNNWDSNAAKGTPSIGMFQTIGPTFNTHKLPGMDNIRNPLHNAVAAFRYMLMQYGGGNWTRALRTMSARGGGAYAAGGEIPGQDGEGIPILAHAKEWVLNKAQQSKVANWVGVGRDRLKSMLGFGHQQESFQRGGEVPEDERRRVRSRTRGFEDRFERLLTRAGQLGDLRATELQTRRVVWSIERIGIRSERALKALASAFDQITADGGPLDQLRAEAEAQAARLARRIQRSVFRITGDRSAIQEGTGARRGGLGVDPDRQAEVELRNLAIGLDNLRDQRTLLNRLIQENRRGLRRANRDGDDKRAAQLRKAFISLTETREELAQEIADQAQAIVERQEEAQQDLFERTRESFDRSIQQIERRQGLNELFGAFDASLFDQAALNMRSQIGKLIPQQQRASATGNTELAREIQETIEDLEVQIVENAVNRVEAIVERNERDIERYGAALERSSSAREALGTRGGSIQSIDDQLRFVGDQIALYTNLIGQAANAGAGAIVVELQDKIADLQASITGLVADRLNAAIEDVNSAAERESARIETRRRLAELGVDPNTGAYTVAGLGRPNFGAQGSLLLQQRSVLERQRGGLSGLLNQAISQGNQRAIDELTQQIDDLNLAIYENIKAVQENTEAAFTARVDRFTTRSDFFLGLNQAATTINDALGSLAGLVDEGVKAQLLRARGEQLREAGTGTRNLLADLLGGRVDRGALLGLSGNALAPFLEGIARGVLDKGIFTEEQENQIRSLIDAVLANEQALLENTDQLDKLSNPRAQTFTSTAFQLFRQAILTGSGGLLPQYDIPQLHNGGDVVRSGLFNLQAGEKVSKPGDGGTTIEEMNVNVTNPSEVLDAGYVGQRIGFELNRKGRR